MQLKDARELRAIGQSYVDAGRKILEAADILACNGTPLPASITSSEIFPPGMVRYKRTYESVMGGCRLILKEAGKPVHISNLFEELQKRGLPVKPQTMASCLSRGKDFKRCGKGYWKIITEEEQPQ